MTITLANGNTLDIIPSDDSARYSELMGDEYIELRFESAEYIEIAPGSSVVFDGTTYHVERPQDVEIMHRRGYSYSCRFYPEACRLKYIDYINPDDGRVSFSVTGTADTHLGLLVRGINMLATQTWTKGNNASGNEEKVINYDCMKIRDAIELIAETFGTEYEIIGTAVYLRKVEYNKSLPLPLEYGEGNGLQAGIRRTNYGDMPPVVALSVEGGARNLNTSSSQDAYDSKTLHMPVELLHDIPMVVGYDGAKFAYSVSYSQQQGYSYISEVGFNATGARYYTVGVNGRVLFYAGKNASFPTMPSMSYGTAMETKDLSDIYPNLTHTVTAVSTETVHGNDGETFMQYSVTVSTNIDYNDAHIPGTELTVVFQSGMLAGKEFAVDYRSAEHKFTLVRKVIDDEYMPDGVWIPEVGDTFRVFGCMLPQQYIRDDNTHTGAEWDMAKEAVKTLHGIGASSYTWNASLDGIYAAGIPAALFAKIKIGGYVSFYDPEVQAAALLIRIVSIKQPLNHPKWPEITLAEKSVARRKAVRMNLTESRKEVKVSAQLQQVANTAEQVVRDIDRNTIAEIYVNGERAAISNRRADITVPVVMRNTTDYWEKNPTLIPGEGDIYIYEDAQVIDKDGKPTTAERIKIGTGKEYLGQLKFIDQHTQERLEAHIADNGRHVNTGERERWNSKLNIDPNPNAHYINETLIFNRD